MYTRDDIYNTKTNIERRRALTVFEDSEETLDFLDNYGFGVEKASVLERLTRYSEAADILLDEGKIEQAVELLIKDYTILKRQTARQRAEDCLLRALWQQMSFGRICGSSEVGGAETLSASCKLLLLAEKLRAVGGMSSRAQDEVGSWWWFANSS